MFSREKNSERNSGRNGLGRMNGRSFLKRKESYRLIKAVNQLFDKRIKHERIRKFGKYSKIRTAIREEEIKLGQYIMGEKKSYEQVSFFKECFE